MPTQQETSRCTDRSHAARGADSTCCVGFDEVDRGSSVRAYGHEHLEAELVGRPVRLRDIVLVDVALAASAPRAMERFTKGCSVGHFDDAPRLRVTRAARVIL
eukprot:2295568-Prymnesium_polylepis.1